MSLSMLGLDALDPSPVPWGGLRQLGKHFTREALKKATADVASLSRSSLKSASLGNKEARLWYKNRLKEIPEYIDKSLPLEKQARQAFELRNSFKNEARDLMADRRQAAEIDILEPPYTWEELVQKAKDEGYRGDDIYQYIIDSSQRSRPSVDKIFGISE